jgi:hypothetical protein
MRGSNHFEFRTIALLYIISGGVIAFLIHFYVLSTPWANGIHLVAR